MLKEFNQEKIEECNSFTCWCKRTNEDLMEYNKIRDMYVQNRKTYKVIQKQEKKKNPGLQMIVELFGKPFLEGVLK